MAKPSEQDARDIARFDPRQMSLFGPEHVRELQKLHAGREERKELERRKEFAADLQRLVH